MDENLFEKNIQILRDYSISLKKASNSNTELINQLKGISPTGKSALLQKYKNAYGPVKDIRRKVAEYLVKDDLDEPRLAHLIEQSMKESEKSFKSMYKDWYNIFYTFLIYDFKASVGNSLNEIAASIIEELGESEHLTAKIFDFTGERETGSTRCWIAIINNVHDKQSTAKQLFLNIENGEVEYAYLDWPAQKGEDQVIIKKEQPFIVKDLMQVFRNHLSQILNDEESTDDFKNIVLKEGERIYKISMGPADIDEETFNFFVGANLILVNGSTKPIATSKDSQGEVFRNQINEGDYFYLCRGNQRFVLIGRFNGPAEECDDEKMADEDWKQRSFETIQEATSNKKYQKERKWWTPNYNSTCIKIPTSEFEKANRVIFNPFFKSAIYYKEVTVKPSQSTKPMNISLNQILFGPPGTGKTYHTIDKALEILNENITEKTRSEIKAIYDQKVKNGQIMFTTFHQSMSYEDFVEGIKPETLDGKVIYSVLPGIFKQICGSANTPNYVSFNSAYEKLISELSVEEILELQTPKGKTFGISLNANNNLTLHTGQDLKKQGTLTRESIQRQLDGESVYKDWESYFNGVISLLKNEYSYSEGAEKKPQKFILIIDEINRGNVSQIFGELITLIEEDKRHGKDEALSVILPYSKKEFNVPANLYLIGTMNTADRSVEALDSALRRRFSFMEMRPQPELLTPSHLYWKLLWDYKDADWDYKEFVVKEKELLDFLGASEELWTDRKAIWDKMEQEKLSLRQVSYFDKYEFSGINLALILNTINKRIEKLLDKDHLIGHSYLIRVDTIQKLKEVFQNKIIPLLQEYFYGDFGKIGLVLGRGFVKERMEQNDNIFAKFVYETSAFEGKISYELIDYTKEGDDFILQENNESIKIDFSKALEFLIESN